MGVQVFFVDDLPSESSEGTKVEEITNSLLNNPNCHVTSIDSLVSELQRMNLYEISVSQFSPYLRSYHYSRDNLEIFIFF